MIDSSDPGEPIIERAQTNALTPASRQDEFVRTSTSPTAGITNPAPTSPVTVGHVLWTLTQRESTAQARRWVTPSGYELEMQIWTGQKIEGQEDLCWSQLFPSEESLAEIAFAKKLQLEAAGWIADIDTTTV